MARAPGPFSLTDRHAQCARQAPAIDWRPTDTTRAVHRRTAYRVATALSAPRLAGGDVQTVAAAVRISRYK